MEMARRHPQLTTEIITEDALVDVVEGRFDAGIRRGEMIAQDMDRRKAARMFCGNGSSGLVRPSSWAISAALSVISTDLRLSSSWFCHAGGISKPSVR
jgi:DNA-binding transcriptional LysR family regulator